MSESPHPNRRGLLAGGAALTLGAGAPLYAVPCDGWIRLPDGRRLQYRQFGVPHGPAVIYLHGMPGSRLEAGLIAQEAVTAGVRLISLNRPGIGGSDFQRHRRVLDFPRDLLCVASALGLGCFSLLGVSGGAPFALAAAAGISARVRRVAIVSGHGPFHQGLQRGNQDGLVQIVGACPRLGQTALSLIKRRLRNDPAAALDSLAKSWTDADRRLVLCDGENRRQFLQNLREAFCQPRGLAWDIRLLARQWGFELACAGRVPVALWHGCYDELVPPAHARYLHAQIPGSRLTLDPHGSHVTTVKRHAYEMLSFLAG